MREIKFRAWDGSSNRMIYPNGIFPAISFAGDVFQTDSCGYMKSPYLLMQYTGLKDKNGKEIYEGDFLRSEWRAESFLIGFSNGAFRRDRQSEPEKGTGFIIDSNETMNCEVIGNIYESPELPENGD